MKLTRALVLVLPVMLFACADDAGDGRRGGGDGSTRDGAMSSGDGGAGMDGAVDPDGGGGGDDATPGDDAASGGESSVNTEGGTIVVTLPDGGTWTPASGPFVGSCDEVAMGRDLGTQDCACVPGTSAPCFVVPPVLRVGACSAGTAQCPPGGELNSWGACMGAGSPSPELCDGIDNNCDNRVDEGCRCTLGDTRPCYNGPAGSQGVGACHAGVQSCEQDLDGQVVWGDCVGSVVPSYEHCDGSDSDCDGTVNNGCMCPINSFENCYDGPAGTAGHGLCRTGIRRCVQSGSGGSFWLPCEGQVVPGAEHCGGTDDANCNGHAGCSDPVCASDVACVPVCMPGSNTFTLEPGAEVLFLTDRSGSMNTALSGGSTRWRTLRSAMRSVLPGLDTTLGMGLLIFPDPSSCTVASTPTVAITEPSATAILDRLDLSPDAPDGAATPTLAALQTAQRYFTGRPITRPRFIVLATDGEPNCGGDLSSVLSELRTLRSSIGVETFVLGIPGTDSSLVSALNQMADAGGRALTGSTHYYDASTASTLNASLRSIVSTASCLYPLGRTPHMASDVTIRVDGVTVPMSTSSGWSFTDSTLHTIQLFGSSCATLRDGRTHTITADYSC